MTIKRIAKAALARGMAFNGDQGETIFYTILTPHGYYRSTRLRDIYRVVMLYDKIDWRVTFRK